MRKLVASILLTILFAFTTNFAQAHVSEETNIENLPEVLTLTLKSPINITPNLRGYDLGDGYFIKTSDIKETACYLITKEGKKFDRSITDPKSYSIQLLNPHLLYGLDSEDDRMISGSIHYPSNVQKAVWKITNSETFKELRCVQMTLVPGLGTFNDYNTYSMTLSDLRQAIAKYFLLSVPRESTETN